MNLNRNSIVFFLSFAKHNWHQYIFPFALILITPSLLLYSAILIENTVNSITQTQDISYLFRNALLFLIISFSAYFLQAIQNISLQNAGLNTLFFIRSRIIKHICFMKKLDFEKYAKGTLVNRVTTDIEQIGETFLQGVADIIIDFFSIFAILVYIFFHGWQWGLITLLFLPIFLFTINYFQKALKVIFRRKTFLSSKLSARINESFSMLEEINSFNLSSFQSKKFSHDNKRLRLFSERMVYYESILYSIFDAVLGIIIALFFLFISSSLINQWNLGFVVAYIILVKKIFEPIKELSGKVATIQGALGSLDKLKKLFVHKPYIDKGVKDIKKLDIEFKKVHFSYEEGKKVLEDLSFTIKEHSSTAIVGQTGSGKTTIANLLLRYYRADKGDILIGGIPIEDIKKTSIEKNINIVNQFSFFSSRFSLI